jgi:phospholipid/cholesterol/gamma-HCH transport system substrate-binding protein
VKLSKEAKVGLVVSGAIAALIWGINYLKGSELFSRTNRLYAVYTNIDGLVTSNQVVLNGYKVGQVQQLRFIPDNSGRILATFRVRKDVFIAANSIARIVSSDLLGGKAVEIVLGDGTATAADGDTLASELNSGLAQQFGPVKDKAENLIQSLDTVATALHDLLDEKGRKNLSSSFEHLSGVMANLERLTLSLDRMAARNGSLSNTVGHFESVSANLEKNNDRMSGTIRNMETITDSLAGADLGGTVRHLGATLREMDTALARVNAGRGSLGKLATDDSLYVHLTATMADLDRLLVDLKANPKKYVHFSLFGKKSK